MQRAISIMKQLMFAKSKQQIKDAYIEAVRFIEINRNTLAIKWTKDHIEHIASVEKILLTEREVEEVLQRIDFKHDHETGVNWNIVKQYMEEIIEGRPGKQAIEQACHNLMKNKTQEIEGVLQKLESKN